jgi:outer membrane protein assembly factor BamB
MISNKTKHMRWYTLAKNIAIIAAIFAIIISILLIVNYIQTKSIEPLNSKALNQLMLRLQQDPDNTALKEQIRALDLLARRAYFTNQWQIRTGGLLLFTFVLLLLISLKYINSLKSNVPDLEETSSPTESWQLRVLSRRSIVYSGLSIFVLAFILGVISEREIADMDATADTTSPALDALRKNWPAFRGPEGNGIAYQSGYPIEWGGSSGKNIIWKSPVPKDGFNSPIIWDNLLFIAGADDTSRFVYAISTASGTIVWQTGIKNIPGSPEKPPRVSGDTGYAAPTMATDGTYVCAIFANGDIACLDFNGAVIWAKNLGEPDNHYGHSSSLMTWQNLVLVQYDHNVSRELIALDMQSGEFVYRIPRDVQISWASPIIIHNGAQAEIVLNSNPFVISYDPGNGKELWRVECMDGEVAPSPAYSDQMVFVVNEYALLAGISVGEEAKLTWEYEDDLSEVASPVAADGLLIMPTSYGIVSCFDTKSGEKYWTQEFDDGFYSSPIIAGDLVYLMDINGVMQIFKAANVFEQISQSPLGESAMTIPAFVNQRIYIRGVDNLFCIGNKDEQ